MEIECVLFGPFREDVGTKRVTVSPPEPTAGALLARLEATYPVLEGRLLEEGAAELAGKTVVTKNKTDIRHLEGLETPVSESDTIRLVPSVYGGAQ